MSLLASDVRLDRIYSCNELCSVDAHFVQRCYIRSRILRILNLRHPLLRYNSPPLVILTFRPPRFQSSYLFNLHATYCHHYRQTSDCSATRPYARVTSTSPSFPYSNIVTMPSSAFPRRLATAAQVYPKVLPYMHAPKPLLRGPALRRCAITPPPETLTASPPSTRRMRMLC